MAWLDSRVWCHPKMNALSDRAFRVHINAIAYSDGFSTRGRLSAADQRTIGSTPKTRQELVAAGLWITSENGGIFINDWAVHNGKRDARKEADRERKRAARAKASAGTSAGKREDRRALKSERVTSEGPTTEAAAGTSVLQSALHYAEEQEHHAAAANPENPRERDIRTACERIRADLAIVEPLANALTAERFAEVVGKVELRQRTGPVGNGAGLFVKLLREAVRDQAVQVSPAATLEQQIVTDARVSANSDVPLEVVLELTQRKLKRLGINGDTAKSLIELATATYEEATE